MRKLSEAEKIKRVKYYYSNDFDVNFVRVCAKSAAWRGSH
jgi:hypothetical protein